MLLKVLVPLRSRSVEGRPGRSRGARCCERGLRKPPGPQRPEQLECVHPRAVPRPEREGKTRCVMIDRGEDDAHNRPAVGTATSHPADGSTAHVAPRPMSRDALQCVDVPLRPLRGPRRPRPASTCRSTFSVRVQVPALHSSPESRSGRRGAAVERSSLCSKPGEVAGADPSGARAVSPGPLAGKQCAGPSSTPIFSSPSPGLPPTAPPSGRRGVSSSSARSSSRRTKAKHRRRETWGNASSVASRR